MAEQPTTDALALYIHWPFCVKKCPYCDFNSHVRDAVDQQAWHDALLADLRHESQQIDARPITSIFFGGGTPSLMDPATAAALISEAERLFGFSPDVEITLEANPSSVETNRFEALASAGVNRLSLGIQALDDATLQFLGRPHNVAEGLAALDAAQSHFARVSFDLIYARPNQTPEAWAAELNRALAFGTEHLSLYQLTIEPGTRFATLAAQGELTPLDPDAGADLFEMTAEITSAGGLPAYEISNHARIGAESRHNLIYWRYGDYLGIGPGAHGRRRGVATLRHKKPENFMSAVARNGHGTQSETQLTPEERAREALIMGLRLREGVRPSQIATMAVLDTANLLSAAKVELLQNQGLIEHNQDILRVLAAGTPLLDAILAEIVAV